MADGTWDSAAPGRALGQGMQQIANATVQAAQMQQQQQMHRDKLNQDAWVAEMRWGQKGKGEGSSGNPEVQAAKDQLELESIKKSIGDINQDKADKDLFRGNTTFNNFLEDNTNEFNIYNMNNLMTNGEIPTQIMKATDQVNGKKGEYYKLNKQTTMQNAVSMLGQNNSDFSRAIINTLGQIGEKMRNSPALIKVDPSKTSIEDMFKYMSGSSSLIDESMLNDAEFMKGIAFLKLGMHGLETGNWDTEFLRNEHIEIGTSNGPMKISVADALFGGPNNEINEAINKQAENANRSLENLEAGFGEINTQIAEKMKQIKESWGPDGLFVEDENGVLVERELTEADYDEELKNLLKHKEEYQDYIDEQRNAYNKYIKELTAENTKLYNQKVQLGLKGLIYSEDFNKFTGGIQTLYGSMDDQGNWNGVSVFDQAYMVYMNPENEHTIQMAKNKQRLELLDLQNKVSMQENALLQNDIYKVDLGAQLARQPEISTLNADSQVNMAKANNIQSQSQIIQSDTNLNTAATTNQIVATNNQAILDGDPKTSKDAMARLNTVGRADQIAGAGKNTQSLGMSPEVNAPVQQSVAQPSGGSGTQAPMTKQAEKTYNLFQRRVAEAKSIEELAEIFNKDLELLNSDKVDSSKIYQVLNERLMALLNIPENERDNFDFVNDARVASNGAMKSVIQQFNNITKNSKAMDKNTGLTIASLSHLNSLTSNIEELLTRKDLDGNFLLAAGNTARNLWSEFVNSAAANDASKAQQFMSFLGKGVNKVAPLYFKGNKGAAYEPIKNGKVAISGFNGNIATFQQAVRLQKELIMVGLQEIKALGSYKDDAIMSQVGGIKKDLERKLIALNHMEAVASLEENIGQAYFGDKNTLEAINYHTNSLVSIGADGKITEYKLTDPLLANIQQENPKLYNEYMKDKKKLTEQAEYANKSTFGKGLHNAMELGGKALNWLGIGK